MVGMGYTGMLKVREQSMYKPWMYGINNNNNNNTTSVSKPGPVAIPPPTSVLDQMIVSRLSNEFYCCQVCSCQLYHSPYDVRLLTLVKKILYTILYVAIGSESCSRLENDLIFGKM